ncbi:SPOR domain-containing protein [Tsuneonella sp. HG222]
MAAFAAVPATADVKSGVDAWSRGDYSSAVREWEGPASAGDPDAMFNLGQAYRLGRGVPADQRRAETLYARAANAGHVQAADTYGLMLFQDGRREAALPYVEGAARRGDPRSQYLLGIAYFNGDLVSKDWVKAYALLTQANGQGLPQAAAALAQMDQHIPLAQRQQAAALAAQMQRESDAERGRTLAAADLGVAVTAPGAQPPGQAGAAPQLAANAARLPQPIASVAVSPSVSAARAAVAEARAATGAGDPGEAGASFARPGRATPPAASARAPSTPAAATPALARTAPDRAPPPARQAAAAPSTAGASGPWKLQLGAFGVPGNAEKLWSRLSGRSEIAGKQRQLVPAGRVTKLMATGFANQTAADDACRSLKRSGQECIVTR